MKFSKYIFLSVCLLAAACSEDKKPATQATPQKPALMQPFRFHKAIEVSPGQTYDVVSWGRGSSAVGAYAILHSDSAGMKYTTTTGDLDGTITDVYNADMDTDGNPEILIQSKGKDTVNYARVYAFEFNNSDANKLDFPKLTRSQRKGYRGEDNFYIRDGKLIREFPIYTSNDSAATKTGAKRQLEYTLRSNSFSVEQLSKDSTDVKSQSSTQSVAQPTTVKKKTSSTRKKKTVESKRRRRHRR
ncbi:hypothetical protein FPZ43_01940 [Mucilaginibacter pallidiroseus]|uniref:Uncharacterized protein n=1 Tax=Mucilaginibacter pallidiroseus TaxID=2599295 RepID=A0A563UIU1_9SPHI|nr:PliI family lysozyme inhibitor of I-type lysozyme [Mucilaginibacter pallidiroseus]TWR31261.1 hypothetical protein FPZ43_01940 [Mucilaginibacter pallidiroseus]